MERNSWNHSEAPEPSLGGNSNRESSNQFAPVSKSRFNDAEYKRWSETLRLNASAANNQ
jgi:hypothetical protein